MDQYIRRLGIVSVFMRPILVLAWTNQSSFTLYDKKEE